MIELHTIYPVTHEILHFLYDQLAMREEGVSISHKAMPAWDEHVDFVCSVPYRKWWVIMGKVKMAKDSYQWARVGVAYLSKQNEIGIQIIKEHRRRGFARAVLLEIKRRFRGERLLANVNPANQNSKRLFESVEGRVIQHTYEIPT